MAKYILIKETIAVSHLPSPPFAEVKKTFAGGTTIEGKSYDNGKTISTNPDGSMPSDNMVGGITYPIPIENLQLVTDSGQAQTAQTAVAPSTIFTKKNIVIGLVVLTGIVIIWRGKAILKAIK